MNNHRILVVDDEERVRDMIKEYLSIEDYLVEEAGNGVDALELTHKNDYSLIILDVMMPKLDGWGVCKKVRAFSKVPIIMVSARGEEYDRLLGFELGVDDYVVKPFSPKELLARMKAVIRRTHKDDESETYTYGGLQVEFDSRNVFVKGEKIELTPKEFELLKYFIINKGRALSREQILNQVWGYEFMGEDRTVDTHVKMLRESIKEYRKFIVTVWGHGYKFEVGDDR